MKRKLILACVVMFLGTVAGRAQLAPAWVIPAAAHASGALGTFWMTDLVIHNPHEFDLPVVVQLLPSGRENWSVPTMELTLTPWETVNLWDVLGPEFFDRRGTGAILVYTDIDVMACETPEACDLVATSRTYTLDPSTWAGEYAQSLPGTSLYHGMDWNTFAYAAGIMNDGTEFRANAGVASWTAEWTVVRMDLQDSRGNVVDTEEFVVPPFGHLQRRIWTPVMGGSAVFYLVDGPDDALVFPYATVVNNTTGDPSYVPALVSGVGVTVAELRRGAFRLPERPAVEGAPLRPSRETLVRPRRVKPE